MIYSRCRIGLCQRIPLLANGNVTGLSTSPVWLFCCVFSYWRPVICASSFWYHRHVYTYVQKGFPTLALSLHTYREVFLVIHHTEKKDPAVLGGFWFTVGLWSLTVGKMTCRDRTLEFQSACKSLQGRAVCWHRISAFLIITYVTSVMTILTFIVVQIDLGLRFASSYVSRFTNGLKQYDRAGHFLHLHNSIGIAIHMVL